MPELPEVETVRRGLAAGLIGRRVQGVELLWPGSWQGEAATSLAGAVFVGVRRRGKLLILDLADGRALAVHLRMTGQLILQNLDSMTPGDSRSLRLRIQLDQGQLLFNDQRKFGRVELLPPGAVDTLGFVQRLGPEPLEPDYTWTNLAAAFAGCGGRMVKAAILDQSVVAGVGNIYADEVLWEAGIHPERRVASLGKAEIRFLHQALQSILNRAIECGGSTERNYLDAHGQRGRYLDEARVYHRQGKACSRCGASIVKLKVAGRGTHICPHCQRLF